MRKLKTTAFIITLFLITLAFPGCKKDDNVTVDPTPTPPASVDTSWRSERKILILMYHDLTEDSCTNIYQRTTDDFENDLMYLKSRNYQVIGIDDLIKLKSGDMKLTTDAVIITFDDGYLSSYTLGYPILKKYAMPATIFVVTEWLGQPDRMSWANAWEMDQYRTNDNRKLMSIDSHSSSHPFLLTDSGTFANHAAYQSSLNAEICDSKTWIQNVTGQTTMWLALPFGDGARDPGIINTAKNCGYNGIRTSIYGSFTISTMDPFIMPSLPILSTTNIHDVRNYLN